MSATMLSVESVTVRFDNAAVVAGVSLSAHRGEWLGVIGPNGAGKSTLLRAIAQLQRCRGRVTIDSVPIRHVAARRRARLAAYVPQKPEVPAGMDVIDYTLLGRTSHIGQWGVETDRDRDLCDELLDRLDIRSLAHRMLSTLSGGELQRAVLARALAQEAPVLLLDEPTSALDLGNRVDALELVDQLRRERALTVVSVMHDLTLAGQFADRLLLLDRGHAVATGTAAQVLTETQIGAIFGHRVRIVTDATGARIVAPVRTRAAI